MFVSEETGLLYQLFRTKLQHPALGYDEIFVYHGTRILGPLNYKNIVICAHINEPFTWHILFLHNFLSMAFPQTLLAVFLYPLYFHTVLYCFSWFHTALNYLKHHIMPELNTLDFGYNSATEPSRTPQERTITPRRYQQEVAQEAAINQMIRSDRHSQLTFLLPPSTNEVQHFETDDADPFSTLSMHARCSEEQLSSRGSSVTSTTDAEEFYRSSADYRAGIEQGQRPVGSDRPLTPYPRDIASYLVIPAKFYSSVPLDASQRRAFMGDYAPPAPTNSMPRRRYGYRRAKTPPPRLPADYRPETAFSFNRPLSPAPFSSSDARAISPSHWLYSAPRVDGVDLELCALNQALEKREAVHRTLWPEEQLKMMGEVHGMRVNLMRNAGIVRNEEVKVQEEIHHDTEQHEKKEKKTGWFKKLWVKKKKEEEPATVKPGPAQNGILKTIEVTSSYSTAPLLQASKDVAPTHPTSAPQLAGKDQKYPATSTTVIAEPSPITTTSTISPPSREDLAWKSAMRIARSANDRHTAKRRSWWRLSSPRADNHVPRSRKSLRLAGYRRLAQSSEYPG
jgi:hypothetical protein